MTKGRLSFRKIILGFIFLLIVFVGIPYYLSLEEVPEGVEEEIDLVPSEVLNNKSEYSGKEIIIRGKVLPASVVCERESCPANDSCCGCPDERDLLIVDPEVILVPKAKQRLRLLDYNYQSFCQRRPSSCDYDCQGWVKGGIYDVWGVFFTESPPVGWELPLDQYFEVEDSRLVRKPGFQEVLGNISAEIRGMLGSFRRPGSYVLD